MIKFRVEISEIEKIQKKREIDSLKRFSIVCLKMFDLLYAFS